MNLDFTKMFDEFFANGSGSSAVREVYDIMPTFNQEQLNIIAAAQYYINKYDLQDFQVYMQSIMQLQAKNKNLSFFDKQSTKSLLRAYTVDELLGRVKPSIQHVEEQQN